MTSAHPDFANVAAPSLTDADMLHILTSKTPAAVETLNGRLLEVDSERGIARFRFEIVPAFCHSGGRICQGGFLTGMIDTSMAHAAIAKGKMAVAVPTLELKMSFYEAMGPGVVFTEGRVVRWGGSIGFLEGDMKDEKGRLIAHSTATIKIIRPKKG
jgi:uncharacterized protein (TIGR00369 family)